MMNPDNERVAVKFLVAALGQQREQAREFCRRLPDTIQPQLLATAQTWVQKSCLMASQEFSRLMGVSSPFPKAGSPSTVPPTKKKLSAIRKKQWTPERRAALSRKMKRLWRQKHPTPATRQPETVHDRASATPDF